MASQPTTDIGPLLPVAGNAKAHFEPLAFEAIHCFDLSVAGFAGDLLADMPLVSENHVLGQVKHLDPGRGGVGVEVIVFFFYLRMIGDDILMTEQALCPACTRWLNGMGWAAPMRVAGEA